MSRNELQSAHRYHKICMSGGQYVVQGLARKKSRAQQSCRVYRVSWRKQLNESLKYYASVIWPRSSRLLETHPKQPLCSWWRLHRPLLWLEDRQEWSHPDILTQGHCKETSAEDECPNWRGGALIDRLVGRLLVKLLFDGHIEERRYDGKPGGRSGRFMGQSQQRQPKLNLVRCNWRRGEIILNCQLFVLGS